VLKIRLGESAVKRKNQRSGNSATGAIESDKPLKKAKGRQRMPPQVDILAVGIGNHQNENGAAEKKAEPKLVCFDFSILQSHGHPTCSLAKSPNPGILMVLP